MRHTLRMSAKFLKSDPPIVHSQHGGCGDRVFLQPRYLDTANTWQSLTTISPHRSWGMDMGYATLSTPVTAKAFAISSMHVYDYYSSISEFQANGVMAAVPEPETYAMLLAGLGVMGAVARRRKAQQA